MKIFDAIFGVVASIVLVAVLMSAVDGLPSYVSSLFAPASDESEGYASCGNFGDCLKFEADLEDMHSLQRGAKIFIENCVSCHGARFQRFARIGEDLEIPKEMIERFFLFDSPSIADVNTPKHGSVMESGFDTKDAVKWFGVIPPDLSVHALAKGKSWIYTYLLTFYKDKSKSFGTNNMVLEGASMPNVMEYMQGVQEKICAPVRQYGEFGGVKRDLLTGEDITVSDCNQLQIVEGTGQQSAEQFKQTVSDLTNFLVYLAEPSALKRYEYGVYVILFCLLFSAVAFLMYRDFKRDYKE